MEKYSAGAVSYSFWFDEFQSLVDLRSQYSVDEAKHMILDGNYWHKASEGSKSRAYGAVSHRVDSLSEEMLELFPNLGKDNQLIVNLVSIMNTVKLMRDFMYEVYRPQLIIGDSKIEDFEIDAFFKKIELSHEEVTKWSDLTEHRLQATIKTFLRDSKIVKDENTALLLQRPLLDPRLENQLKEDGHADYVAIFLGR